MKKVQVKLVGEDGNAYAILGRVSKALRRSGQPEAAAEYLARATAGDYNNLLAVTMEYVDEPGGEEEEEGYVLDCRPLLERFEDCDRCGSVGCDGGCEEEE